MFELRTPDAIDQVAHDESSSSRLSGSIHTTALITRQLASRFHVSLPATRISSNALVILNTYKTDRDDSTLENNDPTIPAIASIVGGAFNRMSRLSENQAFLFLGESESGKSTIRSHVLAEMLKISANQVATLITLTTSVFDSLTSIRTAKGLVACKSDLVYQLQFDTSSAEPILVGGCIINNFLHPSRIAHARTQDGGYQILHYLVAGASEVERAHFGFKNRQSSINRWNLLGSSARLRKNHRDAEGFQMFKRGLWELNFQQSEIEKICELLAAVLHFQQLEFHRSTTVEGEDEDGFYHKASADLVMVRNRDSLDLISNFLGVQPEHLEALMVVRLKKVGTETIEVVQDSMNAQKNASTLASMLYTYVTHHIIQRMNQETCATGGSTFKTVSIIDLSGFCHDSSAKRTFDQLLNNSAAEFMYNLSLEAMKRKAEILQAEEVNIKATEYFDNFCAVKDVLNPNMGLLSILDEQQQNDYTEAWLLQRVRHRLANKSSSIRIKSSIDGLSLREFDKRSKTAYFVVKHFAGEIEYPIQGLMDEGEEIYDLSDILKDSSSGFVSSIFQQEAAKYPELYQNSKSTRSSSVIPTRMQGLAMGSHSGSLIGHASHSDERGKCRIIKRTVPQFLNLLQDASDLIGLPNQNIYLMFSLHSNDRHIPGQFSTPCVRAQVQALGIPDIIHGAESGDFSMAIPFRQFITSTGRDCGPDCGEFETAVSILQERQWPSNEAVVGSTSVLLSERCWMELENLFDDADMPQLSIQEFRLHSKLSYCELMNLSSEPLLPITTAPESGNETPNLDTRHQISSSQTDLSLNDANQGFRDSSNWDDIGLSASGQRVMRLHNPKKESSSRRFWVFIVHAFTFLIPDLFIRRLGGMPNKSVIMAWREKLAINIIIWLSCAMSIVFVIVMSLLICPKQHAFNEKELSSHNGKRGSKGSYVAIRGEVFDLAAFIPHHYPPYLAPKLLSQYAGSDITSLFPVQVSALCQGVNGSVSDAVTLDYKPYNSTEILKNTMNSQDLYAKYHDFRAFTNDSRPDWFSEQMMLLRARYRKGAVGYSAKSIAKLAKKEQKTIAILRGRVYDLTGYLLGGRRQYNRNGKPKYDDPNAVNFMHQLVLDVFQQGSGGDVTKMWNGLSIDAEMKSRMQVCLDNLFYIGDLDVRNSVKCQFADYLPLVISVLICSIVAFKFATSLQMAAKSTPENTEAFIICQITAYTEDEESLRRAIDSVTRMKYDDKRKLLVIICDGMIVGEGNEKATPLIVLDILGVLEGVSPKPLSFESIGQGSQQHNMGQVYSGLYEAYGHLVPFLVIVKVGKPSETFRSGNRGKRDSQIILMRFLNRVHYGLAMSPLEREIYHHIGNIIGVNPKLYEFMLQIDTDTVVAQDSASQMTSAFVRDMRLIAVCGETGLSNAKATIVTMMQVYEYFISHNIGKAFESLFGCVTCLPGCFSMYRIYASATGKPLFVSHSIVESYANVHVDTLHEKNLLSLGEDRYLTTLLLKHHGKYKTMFLRSARAWTIAPETWQVFLSQRRRWINSTVHNLVELLSIDQICGFFFFSMHFVVVVDLITTIVQPVAMTYIIYLIVQIVNNPSTLPITAIVILAVVYGIQVISFIIRCQWDMAGWMLIYFAAFPFFSMYLPLYSFWYMDDFDWGNTRVVAGER